MSRKVGDAGEKGFQVHSGARRSDGRCYGGRRPRDIVTGRIMVPG
jgi:hypothetical protein